MGRGENISLNDGYRAEHCVSRSGQSSDHVPDPVSVYIRESLNHELLTPEEEIMLGKQIQAGVAIDYSLRLPEGYRGTKAQRERDEATLTEAQGAVDRMVLSNMRLAAKVATRYGWSSLGYDELLHEGVIGLITAAKKFDPEKGFRFTTYAVWWLRQTIGGTIEKTARMVRIPKTQESNLSKLRNAMDQDPGRTLEEHCEELGLHAGIMNDAMYASRSVMSLDMPMDKYDDQANPKEGRVIDRLAESSDESIVFTYDNLNIVRNLKHILETKFPKRGADMVHVIRRQLLDQEDPDVIAAELNKSDSQIRELRRDAYNYLRTLGREVVGNLADPIGPPESMPALVYREELAEAG
jgi:RNA polymerase sigma factor (sigma-70 family)